MTQSQNRFLDDFTKLITSAIGAAQGARGEVEGVIRQQGERMLAELNLVTREEFDAVKAMAAKARDENDRLAAQVEKMDAQIAALTAEKVSQ